MTGSIDTTEQHDDFDPDAPMFATSPEDFIARYRRVNAEELAGDLQDIRDHALAAILAMTERATELEVQDLEALQGLQHAHYQAGVLRRQVENGGITDTRYTDDDLREQYDQHVKGLHSPKESTPDDVKDMLTEAVDLAARLTERGLDDAAQGVVATIEVLKPQVGLHDPQEGAQGHTVASVIAEAIRDDLQE